MFLIWKQTKNYIWRGPKTAPQLGDQTTKLIQNMAQLVFIFIEIPLLLSFIVDSIVSLFQFLVSNVMSILRETQWEPDSCDNKWANLETQMAPDNTFPWLSPKQCTEVGGECNISGFDSVPVGQYPVCVYICV